jgi:hypothetical protein
MKSTSNLVSIIPRHGVYEAYIHYTPNKTTTPIAAADVNPKANHAAGSTYAKTVKNRKKNTPIISNCKSELATNHTMPHLLLLKGQQALREASDCERQDEQQPADGEEGADVVFGEPRVGGRVSGVGDSGDDVVRMLAPKRVTVRTKARMPSKLLITASPLHVSGSLVSASRRGLLRAGRFGLCDDIS